MLILLKGIFNVRNVNLVISNYMNVYQYLQLKEMVKSTIVQTIITRILKPKYYVANVIMNILYQVIKKVVKYKKSKLTIV